MVVAQTIEGELGILPGHEPLLGQLIDGGVVKIYTADGEKIVTAVFGGFLSVSADGVSILAEAAEFAHEIDSKQAESDLSHTEELVRVQAAARLRAISHL
jgi:F-type H+-transporting ATPase subunit epsilon